MYRTTLYFFWRSIDCRHQVHFVTFTERPLELSEKRLSESLTGLQKHSCSATYIVDQQQDQLTKRESAPIVHWKSSSLNRLSGSLELPAHSSHESFGERRPSSVHSSGIHRFTKKFIIFLKCFTLGMTMCLHNNYSREGWSFVHKKIKTKKKTTQTEMYENVPHQ